ncbi:MULTISPECIES: N-acetylmuramate alpha-1-phosphate uridylyltransferase MurU [unclassified Methylophaga]|jgi:MurNAc alpha-1-phosphate uridylyltransferase|uniref:N-acetylmuramate alpha-1-phosphate uridylyltransferase MurU n=2 Tax=Methylophaga TaxID=40222 RepID=UPI000C910B2C|nr:MULTISPECIES: nucleotidyltransferase family protein [unclassified Methylophaga]MAK65424.1 mannose-1-phosphate guanylyltransferase [Methylophaga sp.]MAY16147.1 mannose-1-phosphate guanylyltransferase [Methylophaga sp.]HCD04290.1 mannose-1-phosphate guanylyltransferase [Methylophaga sp.]|tara:strand:- start:9621 stop:10295 length:675 start_codon:yes stop_codon:yes gene_type:complete
MKVMILAAGRGERLRPLTDHTPKPLLHAGSKRLIEYLIEKLVNAGFKDIVINHAHLGEQFEPVLGNGERYQARFEYSAESMGGLETAGGIIHALPLLGNKPFLVVNGDIWTDFPFKQLNESVLAEHMLCHLIMVKNPQHNPSGDFHLDSEGLLKIDGDPRLTFSGIGIYRPEMFAGHKVAKLPLKPLLVEAMSRKQVTGQYYQGEWSDIGTVERLTALAKQLDV